MRACMRACVRAHVHHVAKYWEISVGVKIIYLTTKRQNNELAPTQPSILGRLTLTIHNTRMSQSFTDACDA